MKCERCGVTVRGDFVTCPLCQQELQGEPIEGVFPKISPQKLRLRKIISFAAFVSIVALVICVLLNVALPSYGWWSLFVAAGMASLWLSLGVLIQKRDNVLKAIIWQVALIAALAFIWDLSTGFRGWSVDFVIPILFTAAMAAMAIFSQAAKLSIEDYLIYLVINSVLGILCVLLIVFDVVKIALPALICVACSVISLAALSIFEGKALREELKRRLHL